jgi:hypothetical protein
MSIAPAATTPHLTGRPSHDAEPAPRVRHQARDAATLMMFSAAASVAVAALFLFLTLLARQA